jgi:hypothetical protein
MLPHCCPKRHKRISISRLDVVIVVLPLPDSSFIAVFERRRTQQNVHQMLGKRIHFFFEYEYKNEFISSVVVCLLLNDASIMGNRQTTSGLSPSLTCPLLAGEQPEINAAKHRQPKDKMIATATAVKPELKRVTSRARDDLVRTVTEGVLEHYKKHPFGPNRFYPEEPFAGRTAQALHNATLLVSRLGLPDRVILEGTPRDALVIARWTDHASPEPPNLIAEFTFRSFSWNYNGGSPHGLLRFFALIEYKNHGDFVLRPVLPVTPEQHFILVRKSTGWEVELDRRTL